MGKTFTYRKIRNVEYKDSDSPDLLFDVESSGGMRLVRDDEGYLVTDSCHPKELKKMLRPRTT